MEKQLTKLLAEDGAAGDYFGYSVSVNADGTVALIGAPNDNGVDSGSVYVFTQTNGVWTQTQKLLASDAAAGDYFGASCALNSTGTLALIGAYGDDDLGTDTGTVYVFTQSNGVWTQTQKLHASDGTTGDYFGVSCALNDTGTLALIGAHGDDDLGALSGTVYVFTQSNGVWTQTQKLHAGDGAAYAYFGISSALNSTGTLALIGAYADDDLGSASGSVYVFENNNGVWVQTQKLHASDGAANDYFGASCALNSTGTLALIGVHGDGDVGTDTGLVYVFEQSNGVWTQTQKILASDGVAGDYFGGSCALNGTGTLALIGAHGDDDLGADTGLVYVFTQSNGAWTQ